MDLLDALVTLSHDFGGPDYVRGGGGNTSCKDATTLWVKPSGTTLLDMARERFVAMDRARLATLFTTPPPDAPGAREALVKDLMAAAVLPDSSGRPSVEAPLHESFDATFVIHTHPALVNGMTCAVEGEAVCRRLFPDALWVDYTDPGYTVCMVCREAMEAWAADKGAQPEVVFLRNHGVFVAGDTVEAVRATYSHMLSALRVEYERAGIAITLPVGPAPSAERVAAVAAQLQDVLGEAAKHVCATGPYAVSEGPISPDHIVYSKSYHLLGEPTADAVEEFHATHGYPPRVLATGDAVFGLGDTERNAGLALEFSQDGALVMQLAGAFGGIAYLDARARDFIDHWEVEAYRRKIAAE